MHMHVWAVRVTLWVGACCQVSGAEHTQRGTAAPGLTSRGLSWLLGEGFCAGP